MAEFGDWDMKGGVKGETAMARAWASDAERVQWRSEAREAIERGPDALALWARSGALEGRGAEALGVAMEANEPGAALDLLRLGADARGAIAPEHGAMGGAFSPLGAWGRSAANGMARAAFSTLAGDGEAGERKKAQWPQVLDALLDAGALIDGEPWERWSPLRAAERVGSLGRMGRLLLEKGASPRPKDWEWSAEPGGEPGRSGSVLADWLRRAMDWKERGEDPDWGFGEMMCLILGPEDLEARVVLLALGAERLPGFAAMVEARELEGEVGPDEGEAFAPGRRRAPRM